MAPYEGPLCSCELPEVLVPNEYIVFLERGYSLDVHKQAVGSGVDLDAAMIRVFDPTDPTVHIHYGANRDDGLLPAVRADSNVDMVECSVKIYKASKSAVES